MCPNEYADLCLSTTNDNLPYLVSDTKVNSSYIISPTLFIVYHAPVLKMNTLLGWEALYKVSCEAIISVSSTLDLLLPIQRTIIPKQLRKVELDVKICSLNLFTSEFCMSLANGWNSTFSDKELVWVERYLNYYNFFLSLSFVKCRFCVFTGVDQGDKEDN